MQNPHEKPKDDRNRPHGPSTQCGVVSWRDKRPKGRHRARDSQPWPDQSGRNQHSARNCVTNADAIRSNGRVDDSHPVRNRPVRKDGLVEPLARTHRLQNRSCARYDSNTCSLFGAGLPTPPKRPTVGLQAAETPDRRSPSRRNARP